RAAVRRVRDRRRLRPGRRAGRGTGQVRAGAQRPQPLTDPVVEERALRDVASLLLMDHAASGSKPPPVTGGRAPGIVGAGWWSGVMSMTTAPAPIAAVAAPVEVLGLGSAATLAFVVQRRRLQDQAAAEELRGVA